MLQKRNQRGSAVVSLVWAVVVVVIVGAVAEMLLGLDVTGWLAKAIDAVKDGFDVLVTTVGNWIE